LSSKDLFLEALKSQYDKEFELKDALEGKANNLLTIAGVVSTLLFGFGTFLISNLNADYQPLPYLSFLLVVGVVTNIISILFSVMSFKIQPYSYAMAYNNFYNEDGTFNEETIEEYRDEKDVNVFKETIIETYLRCIKHNDLMNNGKALTIKIAQWFFFAGALTIPLMIGILLFYLPHTSS